MKIKKKQRKSVEREQKKRLKRLHRDIDREVAVVERGWNLEGQAYRMTNKSKSQN